MDCILATLGSSGPARRLRVPRRWIGCQRLGLRRRVVCDLDWFKFIGLSIVIFNGGQAVYGVVTGGYSFAVCSLAIGVAWLWLLEIGEQLGRG